MSDSNYRVTAIRLKNFMGFVDSDWIELRPITLLFGRNSSGKSAIIRALLMLKQSMGRRASAVPLVLSGDLVDLGTFYNMVQGHVVTESVSFAFKIEHDSKGEDKVLDDDYDVHATSWMRDAGFSQFETAVLQVAFELVGEEILLKSVMVLETDIKPSELVFSTTRNGTRWNFEAGENANKQKRMKQVELFVKNELRDTQGEIRRDKFGKPLYENNFLGSFPPFGYQTNWSNATLQHVLPLHSIPHQSDRFVSFIPFLLLVDGAVPVDIGVHKDWGIVNKSLDFFRDHLRDFLENITYLKPLRDEAKRFYPADEDWVRALMQAESTQRQAVDWWLHWASQDARVDTSKLSNEQGVFTGRVELQIKADTETDGKSAELVSNLREVGVGVSQVLPVLVKSLQAGAGGLVIIEQPELHLHPDAQAALADFFIAVSHSEEAPRFLLETHSSSLIFRIRRRLAETTVGWLDKEEVMQALKLLPSDIGAFVIYREKDAEGRLISSIAQVIYDSLGEYDQRPQAFIDFFGSDAEELYNLKLAQTEAQNENIGGSPIC